MRAPRGRGIIHNTSTNIPRRSTGHRSAHTTTAAAPAKPMTPSQRRAFLKYVRSHRTSQVRYLPLEGTATVELGRTKPYDRYEKPRLVIEHYLDPSALPPPPAIVDRASLVTSWPMYGNDTKPDCTLATAGHEIQSWTAYAKGEVTLTADVIEQAFLATGPADQGRNIQDVLAYWQKTGIGGHQIGPYAQLTGLDNLTLAKQCLDLFGTIYLGINVPQSAMDQFRAGEPWDFVGDTNIIGGHAVPVQYWGTDEPGEIEVVTWGTRWKMTRAFWYRYVEEAWVVFSPDSINGNGINAAGLDWHMLSDDFTALTGRPVS